MKEILPDFPDDGTWYCITVKAGKMALVKRGLYARGYRVFIPNIKRWASHARRRYVSERSVLGNYLFVCIDFPHQSFGDVRKIYGVGNFMATAGKPIAFSYTKQDGEQINPVIDLLVRQLRGEWNEIGSETSPPVGALVEVVEGPHDGKQATVTGYKGGKIFVKVEGDRVPSTMFSQSIRPAERERA